MIEPERIKDVRSQMLLNLKVTYPRGLAMDRLFRVLLGSFPDLEWEDFRRDVVYLEEKGYVSRVVAPLLERDPELTAFRERTYRLTARGVEIADRCIDDPAVNP